MTSVSKPKSRRAFSPDHFPELEVASADDAFDTTTSPTIRDDDNWLGDTVEDAVIYAGGHRIGVDQMMH